MFTNDLTVCNVKQAVEKFSSLYAEMEHALWCLSRASADAILAQEESAVIEGFVWTIKSWWGIQGVRKETKTMAATALLELDWDHRMLEPNTHLEPSGERFAVKRVADFVDTMRRRGVPRREWCLASKVLHWLMPWRIPCYDSFVKKSLGISLNADPKEAYWSIVSAEFEASRWLLQQSQEWFGAVEPRSPFRALDKYLWWLGGGNAGRAVIVNDPWEVVRSLGLKAC